MPDKLLKKSDAVSLIQEILNEVKSQNPQLSLKFELNDK
jgi:hypothetical protein